MNENESGVASSLKAPSSYTNCPHAAARALRPAVDPGTCRAIHRCRPISRRQAHGPSSREALLNNFVWSIQAEPHRKASRRSNAAAYSERCPGAEYKRAERELLSKGNNDIKALRAHIVLWGWRVGSVNSCRLPKRYKMVAISADPAGRLWDGCIRSITGHHHSSRGAYAQLYILQHIHCKSR